MTNGAIAVDPAGLRESARALASAARAHGAGSHTVIATTVVTSRRDVDANLAEFERALAHHHEVLGDQAAAIARLLTAIADGFEQIEADAAGGLRLVARGDA
jgi:orotidine-5'-phosphate decarboxylase